MTPFTRYDLVRCVQSKNPAYKANSINPIIQGVTDNLRGGAPGAVGKNILHSVGRGLFVLKRESRGNREPLLAVTSARDKESRAGETSQLDRQDKSIVHASNGATLRLRRYDFRYVCTIDPDREVDGTVREFMPQAGYNNTAGLPRNRYGNGPFCKFKIPPNMEFSGVYALTVNGEVRYIGECARLSSRYNSGYGNISPRNCFVGGQETNCRINNLVLQQIKAGADVSLWFLRTEDYKSIERELRESLSLSWNRV